ncbi:transcription termination/antitermination protein NusG [Staphylococcus hominis]|uniref:Transcription termination/antitermination protein NusG n=1 Tax=Staphylococcus hominis TaxID=1290 RepID=A0A6N0I319_STAHO|nr:transcription termination/antitermination protein NusG [Staphylococcus hominis]
MHTYSGYENKVKKNLEKRVESMNMTEQIFRVVIPEEEETQVKDGKAKKQLKRHFLVCFSRLIMTDESWYVVRNTPGVTGFVGSAGAGSKPNPLLPEEMRFILKQMGLKEKTIDVELDVGEQVRIKSGPFANQVGEVQEIEADKFKLTVLVDMFGRETPVEVEFDQIEKL